MEPSATHTPKHLAEKAGDLAVLDGAAARLAVLAAAAVLLLLRLGAIGVSAPDEPVYTEMAEEVRSFEHGPAGLKLVGSLADSQEKTEEVVRAGKRAIESRIRLWDGIHRDIRVMTA